MPRRSSDNHGARPLARPSSRTWLPFNRVLPGLLVLAVYGWQPSCQCEGSLNRSSPARDQLEQPPTRVRAAPRPSERA